MRISGTILSASVLLCVLATPAAGYQVHLLDSSAVPAEFGPVRQPDVTIDPPVELDTLLDSFWLLPSRAGVGMQGIVIGEVTRANAWSMMVYFWPEFLLLILLSALLYALWRIVRIWRHPQAAGAPMCRRCGYSLAGTAESVTATCPECGAALTQRNRIIGRSRRRRLLVPGVSAMLLSLSACFFGCGIRRWVRLIVGAPRDRCLAMEAPARGSTGLPRRCGSGGLNPDYGPRCKVLTMDRPGLWI